METKIARLTPRRKERMVKAQKDLDTILEEVKPYIKKRSILYLSTTGLWKVLNHE